MIRRNPSPNAARQVVPVGEPRPIGIYKIEIVRTGPHNVVNGAVRRDAGVMLGCGEVRVSGDGVPDARA